MLRHLIGLVIGLIVAPLLWLGVAWAATAIEPVLRGEGFGAPMVLPAVGVLMLVGVICGFLAGTRMSPLAALVSGGLILAFYLWPVVNPASANAVLSGWIDQGTFMHPVGAALPIALPLGTLLFISALAPSRWRRSAAPESVPVAPAAPADEPGSAPGPHGPGRHARDTEPGTGAAGLGHSGPGALESDVPIPPPSPHADAGGDAKTTLPFRRNSATGAAEPDEETPPESTSRTRLFGRGDRP
ncbi:hypothetical protein CDO52_24420 [Nocardiopsis gilva YIM 90087]|uniref:Uncharacterized protein n=1 Tax=Nocardiopsis gilva YIM 90087 TaxID=1235441 RepID=A0A223SBQ2_9ACTN|nr:YIP1 family protein [Nocardiopsis gilva]ASU85525.1 hypothetical protein CDO52_24420 [Nocardiopsis gilva YIM 90087]